MRAYFFGNMYLSSIQQGIQAQHCTVEMFLKYTVHSKSSSDFIGEHQRDMLYDWARGHKTTILLNGGDTEALYDIEELIHNDENPYPRTSFLESYIALNNTLTCVGIILPERVYIGAEKLRIGIRDMTLTEWELGLCLVMNNCRLAH